MNFCEIFIKKLPPTLCSLGAVQKNENQFSSRSRFSFFHSYIQRMWSIVSSMSHKGSFGVGTDAVISFQFSLFISLRVATFTIFLERSNHLLCAYTFERDNARSRIIQNYTDRWAYAYTMSSSSSFTRVY